MCHTCTENKRYERHCMSNTLSVHHHFPPSAYPIRFSQIFHGYLISLLIFNYHLLQQFKWFTCTILYHYVIKIRMQKWPSNILYAFLHVHHMYVVCFCVVSSPQNPYEWQQVTIYVACCLNGKVHWISYFSFRQVKWQTNEFKILKQFTDIWILPFLFSSKPFSWNCPLLRQWTSH